MHQDQADMHPTSRDFTPHKGTSALHHDRQSPPRAAPPLRGSRGRASASPNWSPSARWWSTSSSGASAGRCGSAEGPVVSQVVSSKRGVIYNIYIRISRWLVWLAGSQASSIRPRCGRFVIWAFMPPPVWRSRSSSVDFGDS